MPAPNRSDNGPRFRVRQSRENDGTLSVYIDDDDFGFDATLYLTGDFLHVDRLKYAVAVAKALNAADIPARSEHETACGEKEQP